MKDSGFGRLIRISKIPLVAISYNQYNCMKKKGFNVVDTVYHGIEVEKYKFSKDKDDYLLFLGRIDSSKGTHIAVRVANKLCRLFCRDWARLFLEK